MVVPICNLALGLWRQEGQKYRVILTSHVQSQSRIRETFLKTRKERREGKGRKEKGKRKEKGRGELLFSYGVIEFSNAN